MNTRSDSAEDSFRQISEEVLREENMNWGRVVSLFVYGGRVAEEFWRKREEHRVVEVEEWLTDCVGQREEWIESKGGWVRFILSFVSCFLPSFSTFSIFLVLQTQNYKYGRYS